MKATGTSATQIGNRPVPSGVVRRGRVSRCLLGVVVFAVAAAGCSAVSSPWDGTPWTNTHSEPCREYEPITWEWVEAHPNHPCAQIVPPTSSTLPDGVQLGPACSIVNGEPLRCSSPS